MYVVTGSCALSCVPSPSLLPPILPDNTERPMALPGREAAGRATVRWLCLHRRPAQTRLPGLSSWPAPVGLQGPRSLGLLLVSSGPDSSSMS